MPLAKDLGAARENVSNLINLRSQSQGKRGVNVNIHGTLAKGVIGLKVAPLLIKKTYEHATLFFIKNECRQQL